MSDTGLSRPRALVIGPAFFGYEQDIVAELERQGYEAEFLDERPSNGSLTRAVVRVRPSLISRRIERYFRAAESDCAGRSYALVLVIKAEVVPRWFLESLRNRNPSARFVFYTYDALANSNNCLELLDLFDERLSFDRHDVERDDHFSYLTLFHTPEFSPSCLPEESPERRHQLTFIGTLHSERYESTKRLFAGQEKTFAFFYVQARWYFAATKYLTREHRNVPWSDVTFHPMSKRRIADTFAQSRAVLDVQRSGQAGLTMRTFEVLASGAILVTTNAAIESEPFFDPDRIVVVGPEWDGARLGRRLEGMETPTGPPAGFGDYSLSAWVRRVACGQP